MIGNLFNKNYLNNYSQETIDILRLIRSQNVGPRTFFNLMEFFGSAKNAIENISDFARKGGSKKPIKIFSNDDAEKELELLSKNNAHIITYKDPLYSKLLKEIYSFPPILSYKGNIELLSSMKSISIVGARNSSIQGRAFAAKLSAELTQAGYITVSGLAKGIDAQVHNANTNQTIAVIAGGIDHVYPSENAKLFQQIIENGLLVAELPIGSKPLAEHFPQRNRIISGLSMATVVVEATIKSGSLITARFALEQNRDLFAVPGSPMDPRASGTNKLIKQSAYICSSVDDILENISQLQLPLEESENSDNNLHDPLLSPDKIIIHNKDRQDIYQLLSATPVTLEMLAAHTELSLPAISVICLELELAGKIIRTPGNKISLLFPNTDL